MYLYCCIEPKIRASECQKSVKLLREYIQLVPKSVLSLTNTNTGTDTDVKPSLLQRADQCSLLLKSTENESLISEFYNAAK